jgi:hypothetical protein
MEEFTGFSFPSFGKTQRPSFPRQPIITQDFEWTARTAQVGIKSVPD